MFGGRDMVGRESPYVSDDSAKGSAGGASKSSNDEVRGRRGIRQQVGMNMQTPFSEKLVSELDLYSPLSSPSQVAAVEELLNGILNIIRSSVAGLGAGATEKDAGQMLTIGGSHLGVLHLQDEVDAVYVAPLDIQLRDLAMRFGGALEQSKDVQGVSTVGAEGQLTAPGYRFTYRGRTFVILLTQCIPGLPAPSSTAVVGNTAGFIAFEIANKLLTSVPNVVQFRLLLRLIKFWARQRGVYGGSLGFFGGTAWAICCAHVCQLFPDLELASLTMGFFTVLSRWDWRSPVAILTADASGHPARELCGNAPLPPDAPRPNSTAALSQLQSNAPMQQGNSDMKPAMWVELPVGSGLSATPHISQTTARILQKELRRGHKRLKQVESGRGHWSDVYTSARFFQRHHHYLQFDFTASSEDVLEKWLAWGRQQMQCVVQIFEMVNNQKVDLRPWPEWISFKDAEWPYAKAVFVGLHLKKGDAPQDGERRSYDLREPIVNFLENINAWPDADRYANEFELVIRHVRLAEVEQWLDLIRKGMVANAHQNKSKEPRLQGWPQGGAQ